MSGRQHNVAIACGHGSFSFPVTIGKCGADRGREQRKADIGPYPLPWPPSHSQVVSVTPDTVPMQISDKSSPVDRESVPIHAIVSSSGLPNNDPDTAAVPRAPNNPGRLKILEFHGQPVRVLEFDPALDAFKAVV